MSRFFRAVNAAIAEVKKPASFVSGDDFEAWALDAFDKRYFDLVSRTSDSVQNAQRFAVGDRDYDFLLFDKWQRKQFAIECKYRSDGGVVDLCTSEKFEHYKKVAVNLPFFFVLGVGGRPSSPADAFLIPISKIKFPKFNCSSGFADRFLLEQGFVYSNHLFSGL